MLRIAIASNSLHEIIRKEHDDALPLILNPFRKTSKKRLTSESLHVNVFIGLGQIHGGTTSSRLDTFALSGVFPELTLM